jgi:hypothetical protein
MIGTIHPKGFLAVDLEANVSETLAAQYENVVRCDPRKLQF